MRLTMVFSSRIALTIRPRENQPSLDLLRDLVKIPLRERSRVWWRVVTMTPGMSLYPWGVTADMRLKALRDTMAKKIGIRCSTSLCSESRNMFGLLIATPSQSWTQFAWMIVHMASAWVFTNLRRGVGAGRGWRLGVWVGVCVVCVDVWELRCVGAGLGWRLTATEATYSKRIYLFLFFQVEKWIFRARFSSKWGLKAKHFPSLGQKHLFGPRQQLSCESRLDLAVLGQFRCTSFSPKKNKKEPTFQSVSKHQNFILFCHYSKFEA